jgi:hypothetical protein
MQESYEMLLMVKEPKRDALLALCFSRVFTFFCWLILGISD